MNILCVLLLIVVGVAVCSKLESKSMVELIRMDLKVNKVTRYDQFPRVYETEKDLCKYFEYSECAYPIAITSVCESRRIVVYGTAYEGDCPI